MIVTLVGMSGTGKSYWSQKLAALGFRRLCADDLIEAKLGPELVSLGYRGISDVANWMGQPYEARHAKNSQMYLDAEYEVMREILAAIDAYGQEDTVIDTTGSVIYMPDEILNELSNKTTIVYFHTPVSAYKAMADLYLADPKPVIWGGVFQPDPGETPAQTLARCYPELLKQRTAKYQKLAHITFEYDQLRNPYMTPQIIVDAAKKRHAQK